MKTPTDKDVIRCEDGALLRIRLRCDACDLPVLHGGINTDADHYAGEGFFHAGECPTTDDPAPEWHGLERWEIGDNDAILDAVRKCDVGGLYHPEAEVPDVAFVEVHRDGSRTECEVPCCVHCSYRIERGLPLEKKCG